MKLTLVPVFLAVVCLSFDSVHGQRAPVPSEDPPQPDDMFSNGGAAEQRCQEEGQYRMPRVSIEFMRMPDYDGPVSVWETLPDYTEDVAEVNCHLGVINAYIHPVNYRDPSVIANQQVLEDMLAGNIDIPAVINELYEPDVTQFLRDVVYPAGRTPMFSIADAVMNTTLISMGDQFYTPGASMGDPMAVLPAVIPYGFLNAEQLTALTTEFAHTHMNFWQGLDYETGHVDPNLDPVGVEDRFMFLPPYHPDDVPVFMFYYMGEGVYAKMRIWVGSDMGWDLSYLGMWPHSFVPNSRYNVFFQAVGAYDDWLAWYDLEDPSAQQTVDFFMARNEAQVSPDYDFILNRNPWVRLDQITVENNGIEGVVIGETY